MCSQYHPPRPEPVYITRIAHPVFVLLTLGLTYGTFS